MSPCREMKEVAEASTHCREKSLARTSNDSTDDEHLCNFFHCSTSCSGQLFCFVQGKPSQYFPYITALLYFANLAGYDPTLLHDNDKRWRRNFRNVLRPPPSQGRAGCERQQRLARDSPGNQDFLRFSDCR